MAREIDDITGQIVDAAYNCTLGWDQGCWKIRKACTAL